MNGVEAAATEKGQTKSLKKILEKKPLLSLFPWSGDHRGSGHFRKKIRQLTPERGVGETSRYGKKTRNWKGKPRIRKKRVKVIYPLERQTSKIMRQRSKEGVM